MPSLCKYCKNSCCMHENGGTFVTLNEALRISESTGLELEKVCEFIEDKDLKDENSYLKYYNMFIEIDSQILPLSFNGGSTNTHKLADMSKAIDFAKNPTLPTDQRGYKVTDGKRDSGSFERGGVP